MKSLIDKLLSNKVKFISDIDILTYETSKDDLLTVMNELKNNSELLFSQLTDLCAVDYSAYGQSEWQTKESTSTGYNRGIVPKSNARKHYEDDSDLNNEINYCVVYHLLSKDFKVFDDINGLSIKMPRCKYDVKIKDFYFYDEQGGRLKILP